MRLPAHSCFDDDDFHLIVASPAHKESTMNTLEIQPSKTLLINLVRLDYSGASKKMNLKHSSFTNLGSVTQASNDSPKELQLAKLNKAVKERFYEFYKQIQNDKAYDYFKGLKKNLLIQVDRLLSPIEVCQKFERLFQKASLDVRITKKAWSDEEVQFLISLVTYYTHIKDEDFNFIVRISPQKLNL